MLLPLQSLLKFVSLLESWLCQKVRILDKRFPASIIGSFKLKCRPCLCKCDAEMFPFFLFQNVVEFFKYVIHFLLICSNNRQWYDNAFAIRVKLSYVFFDIHQILVCKIFCFIWTIWIPVWMMILSGSFLRQGSGWYCKFLVFGK